MADDEFIEGAKAVQEASKTTGKAIDAGRDLGGFLSKVFGTIPENLVGVLGGDWLHNKRLERVRIMAHMTEVRLAERGINDPAAIPLNIAVPLIMHGSLEEDDDISEMWANLLANAMDPDSGVDVDKSDTELLNQLGAAEIGLLEVLWRASETEELVRTYRLQSDEDAEKAQRATEEFSKFKDKCWHHFDTSTQKKAIHNLVGKRCAAFVRRSTRGNGLTHIRTGALTLSEAQRNGGKEIDVDALERLIRDIDSAFMTINEGTEPNVFQLNDDNDEDEIRNRYRDPERGMHLSPNGYFLMRACHPNPPQAAT